MDRIIVRAISVILLYTTFVQGDKLESCPITGYDACKCMFEMNGNNKKVWKELHCNNTNFDFDTSVKLLNMSGSTDALDNIINVYFTGNNITVLPRNVLGNTRLGDFWEMKTLDLSDNNIQNISGKTFHAAPELETLILNNNEWYVSDRTARIFSSFFELKKLYLNNAFFSSHEEVQVHTLAQVFEGSELYWLEELHLERNKLETVSPSLFQSLPSLRKLSLKKNRLQGVDYVWDSNCHERTYYTEVFKETCVLEELDLSENNINTISMNLINELMKMDTFKTLDISDNPLHCDDRMKDFLYWINENEDNINKIKNGRDALVCHNPKELKGQRLLELNAKDLKSSGLNKKSSGASGATIAMAVIFSLIAVVLLVVIVVNRRAVIESTGKAVGSIRDVVYPRKYTYTGVNV